MEEMCTKIFSVFDTDSNGLVDALELLATIAMLSGMPVSRKLDFAFRAYDFDQSGKLTVDEMTLALKSTMTGLCKISNEKLPVESNFERISSEAFKRASQNDKNKIEMSEFTYFCSHEPEVRSWIDYFEDPSISTSSRETTNEALPVGIGGGRSKRSLTFTSKTSLFERVQNGDDDAETVSSLSRHTEKISAPSKLPPKEAGRQYPSSTFRLEWVHGFRCKDARNNLRYSSTGKILFHAGSVSVAMEKTSHTQRIHSAHSGDVVSMDVFIPQDHSCTYVATGEIGMNPKIVVWDGDTTETLAVIRGFHKYAVTHLSFDASGKQLVAVGQDSSVVLYALKARAPRGFDITRMFASKSSSSSSILVSSFVGKNRFATGGSGFVTFWSDDENSTYIQKQGLWGNIASKDTTTLCVSSHPNEVEGEVVTGCLSGHLLVWSGRNCVKKINAHFKALNAMYVNEMILFFFTIIIMPLYLCPFPSFFSFYSTHVHILPLLSPHTHPLLGTSFQVSGS